MQDYLFFCLIIIANILKIVSNDSLDADIKYDRFALRDERIDASVCSEEYFPQYSDVQEWDTCVNYGIETGTTKKSLKNFTRNTITSSQPTHCNCDEECNNYGDCCYDSKYYAPNPRIDRQLSCVPLMSNGMALKKVYGIAKCDQKWFSDAVNDEIAEKCETDSKILKQLGKNYSYIQDIAVDSEESGRLYSNVFCAICNYDSARLRVREASVNCENNLQNVSNARIGEDSYDPENKCWNLMVDGTIVDHCYLQVIYTDLINSDRFRECKPLIVPIVSNCPDNYSDPIVVSKCLSYTSYVYLVNDKDEALECYKNFHCALCNKASLEYLSCFPKLKGKIFRDASTLNGWFPVLLDFNFGGESGELVGINQKCRSGELFDPIRSKCVQIQCQSTNQCSNDQAFLEQKNSFATNCTTIKLNESIDFVRLTNGSIFVNKTNTILAVDEYVITNIRDSIDDISQILVCADREFETPLETPFAGSYAQIILSEISLITSIVCLTLHLIVYALLPKLLNLPAKNLMSLSAAILLAHIFFMLSAYTRADRSVWCVLIAVITHYSYLASFCWMSIMAFDVCRTFRRTTRRSTSSKTNTFLKYSLYAWLLPSVIVIIAATFDIGLQHSYYSPLYGHTICWISQRRALLIFFALPIAAVMIANMVLFGLTANGLIQTAEQTKLVRKPSDTTRYVLYVKLAVVMGLTWIFGFVASVTKISALWYPFIILNGLQGAIIFFAFTCKRKVWNQLMARIGCEALVYSGPSASRVTTSDIIRSRTGSTSLPSSTTASPPAVNANPN